MEEAHLVTYGAIAFSETNGWCWRRGAHFGGIHLGAAYRAAEDRGWELESYDVFCEATVT